MRYVNKDIFDVKVGFSNADALSYFKKNGFIQIRNLFQTGKLDEYVDKTNSYFDRPSIIGSYGYNRHQAETVSIKSSEIIGFKHLVLNNSILEFLKNILKEEFILAEAFSKKDYYTGYQYFPLHRDYYPHYQFSGTGVVLDENQLNEAVGVSFIMYHHKTKNGVFTFSRYSHDIKNIQEIPFSQINPNVDSKSKQKLLDNIVYFEGEEKDVILFDPRGFHAQEQPAVDKRIVTICRYWKTKIFGSTQTKINLFPITELNNLSIEDLKILGSDSVFFQNYENDHHRSFSNKKKLTYNLVKFAIEHSYDLYLAKIKLKKS